MLVETNMAGYELCDSSAIKAVACRRLGSLPMCVVFNAYDVGEAKLADGRRVLITWGANVGINTQFWYAHNTKSLPVWTGNAEGKCEVMIGDVHESTPEIEWMWAGLRITQDSEPQWIEVKDTQAHKEASDG